MQAGEVLRTDRGDAWKIYHVNLLEEWREAVPVALVTAVVQRETGRERGGVTWDRIAQKHQTPLRNCWVFCFFVRFVMLKIFPSFVRGNTTEPPARSVIRPAGWVERSVSAWTSSRRRLSLNLDAGPMACVLMSSWTGVTSVRDISLPHRSVLKIDGDMRKSPCSKHQLT